ncbi:unnamed protein product [Bursaphelenchus okinawaensis]|uniref:Galactosylgalactosylxylosylprotein 3-beta-glucuronosyltransferase n=1 Tax=Bursaphelenchus okinawaensis TaxID=465554 RepID=A0A811L7T2_9BILA|nr:unnamed protein product [Bursaphelenchus okinawaensis]CAG9117652.1 unnamed protein product [Bursaphelenchus okinawaensis]
MLRYSSINGVPQANRSDVTLKIMCGILLCSIIYYISSLSIKKSRFKSEFSRVKVTDDKTIIVITPTFMRPERMADFTMLSQALKHVPNVFWLVVEDGDYRVDKVEQVMRRTGLDYAYINTTNEGLPCRGWAHRNRALDWIQKHRAQFNSNDVVYFADDDNAYDIRLFTEYIAKVEVMGVWAVGTSAYAIVESPKVKNNKVVGWNVVYRPSRKFATDMAGFAINIDTLVKSKPRLTLHCAGQSPEDCFLNQLNISWDDMVPFGDGTEDILVWHRKTAGGKFRTVNTNGYYTEEWKRQPKHCRRLLSINEISYEEAVKLRDQKE